MTDGGHVPSEGLPEHLLPETGNDPAQGGGGWGTDLAGQAVPAGSPHPGYTFLDQPDRPDHLDDEDDVLLMPGPQGSWTEAATPVVPLTEALGAQGGAGFPVAPTVPQQPAGRPVAPNFPTPAAPVPVAPVEAVPVIAEPPAVESTVALFTVADPAEQAPAGTPVEPSWPPLAPPVAAPGEAAAAPAPAGEAAAAQPVPPAAVEPQPVQAAVPQPTTPQEAAPQPARRPLHAGPPIPDPSLMTGQVPVRSLADRGPSGPGGTPPHGVQVQPAAVPVPATPVALEPVVLPAQATAPTADEAPAVVDADQQPPAAVAGAPAVADAAAAAAAAASAAPAPAPAAVEAAAEPAPVVLPGQPRRIAAFLAAPAPLGLTVTDPLTTGEAQPQPAAAPAEAPVAPVAEPAAVEPVVEVPVEAAPVEVPVEVPAVVEVPVAEDAPVEAPAVETQAVETPAPEGPGIAPTGPEAAAPVPDEQAPAETAAGTGVMSSATAVSEAPAEPAPEADAPVAPVAEPSVEAPAQPEPVAAEEVPAAEQGTEPAAEAASVDALEAEAAPEAEADAPAEPTAEPVAEAPQPAEQAEQAEQAEVPEDPETPRPPAAAGYDEAMRDAVHQVIRERRDIRNGFRSDPVPHEVLLRVLEAAHTAPSVGYSQPWDFVVIRSSETRRKMHELAERQREAYADSLPKGRAKQFKEIKIEAILDTPVNIVVTADRTRGGRHTLGRHTQPQMAPYSAALAVENLWLAARAEGLGVGWVSFFDEEEMVRELGLPEHLEVVAYLCVGYVDSFPDEPELQQQGWAKKRPLSWVVHEEQYGNRALPGEEPHSVLSEALRTIRPLDAKALGEAWDRQKRMTKPAGSLGMLEIISAQLCGLGRKCPPPIPEPACVAIFAGDHGVHAQGVTPWPQEVTAQMVANFLAGGAVVNSFAAQVGAEVCVVDVGVKAELPDAIQQGRTTGLLPRKVKPGTDDMTQGPAMSREEALKALEIGIETARDLVAAGNRILITGDMGIANTTASAALIAVFAGADPAEVTGRGTGIDDQTHARKVEVVRQALELHQPDPADPIGVLAAVGGLEHAAIAGFLLGAASLRTPVILDGVIAGSAALAAKAIAPEVLAACIAGHRSAEPGHQAALAKLGLRPLIDLDLRLGEGTGALLALPLVQSAARAMHDVATFDSAGVTEKA
ncbi:nicotinate-nucleotide--dimethylbenzimidazole phosphoribosyltransferase [Kitasatospora sp. NPDC052896]|uniref:nicotinate-nucleotide--dimethylbenzimidazole phosphoribosyltransferase n=1 Tax=Kitasatospora sp. NPDC052896 TaxID=3364061 RepID=UPI0037C7711A